MLFESGGQLWWGLEEREEEWFSPELISNERSDIASVVPTLGDGAQAAGEDSLERESSEEEMKEKK